MTIKDIPGTFLPTQNSSSSARVRSNVLLSAVCHEHLLTGSSTKYLCSSFKVECLSVRHVGFFLFPVETIIYYIPSIKSCKFKLTASLVHVCAIDSPILCPLQWPCIICRHSCPTDGAPTISGLRDDSVCDFYHAAREPFPIRCTQNSCRN